MRSQNVDSPSLKNVSFALLNIVWRYAGRGWSRRASVRADGQRKKAGGRRLNSANSLNELKFKRASPKALSLILVHLNYSPNSISRSRMEGGDLRHHI